MLSSNECKDKWFFIKTIKESSFIFPFIPETMRNDKDVVLAAVQTHREALEHAPNRLKNDKDVR